MRIRNADPARDADRCATIYRPYVLDTVISLEDEPPDAAEMRRRMEGTTRLFPWLVAEHDDGLAGYASACRHHQRSAYRWAVDVAVYVAPEHHRRGVGRTLYTRLLELLVDQGFQVACAGVTLPNPASVGFHESFGFETVGIYRRIGFKHGAWHDVGWWQLELSQVSEDSPPEPRPRRRR